MSEIVCQVGNQAGQMELIWSSRGGFFKPYVVTGMQLIELRQAADQTRVALESLVFALNQDGTATPWEPSFELAEAGFRLFNYLLPTEDETARKVRRWLEDVRKHSGLIGLEVVVEERSADAKAFLSMPWNLVYDERPAKYKAAFQKGQGVERWRPFWSARYNLTSGRRVEPLKRLPVWSDPRVVVVVDPTVHEGLNDEQKQRLDQFLAEASLTAVGSLDALEAALEEGYPRLLYWLGHATPEYLMLGDERIAPADLRNLLRSFDDRERPEGMLAFLNACQTAEAGSGGSFLDVLHSFGFTGAIATEQQTIDTFANEFGLAFLQGFLRDGKPLGELLHGLRLDRAPLGLLYGAHCPPEITVRSGKGAADVPALLPIRESGPVAGVALGETATRGRRQRRRDHRSPQKPAPPPVVVPPLPEQPYRSLAFYDEKDRALFTGRDADVVRFAASLDRPDTRILILHGESGTGKSSFLRAGVIPYLEEECVGYRFFRRPDGAVLIVQAAKDLIGGLAQALLDATATSLRYDTPDGEPHAVNLRRVLDEALGAPADYATLREALRRDPHLLAEVLARMAGRLPHALILVLDQAEEVFTLARTPEEVAGRDQGLRMLQRLVDVQADVKLIVSLRTEYYGRLLDHLRAGRRDLTGVRDDLLRDFSRSALIEAITRPASDAPLGPGQPSPREKYGFRYAEGIPGQIADGVLALRSENQDSVLPLVQVICTQLYEREKSKPGMDGVITREDLDAIKGVEGGLRAFAEDALVRSLRLGPADREAFKALFSKLYNRQPDGTLTTWLMPRASLESQWDRPTSFAEMLESAKSVRLLREDELRIEGGVPRRYVRLGHDALAKVAAAWRTDCEERERLERERAKRLEQRRLMMGGSLLAASLAVLFGTLWIKANREARNAEYQAGLARAAAHAAKREERVAQIRLMRSTFSQLDHLWQTEPEKCLALLRDSTLFPLPEDHDFAWGYYYQLCDRVRNMVGHSGTIKSINYSPDGHTLASGAEDQTIKLWDAATGELKATLTGHKGAVQSVAFAPDGRTLASGSRDKTIKLWDVDSGKLKATLTEHEGFVCSVKFSPDGTALASGGEDKTIKLWDVASGGLKATLTGHQSWIQAVAFAPDGRTLASCGGDHTIKLWDVASGGLKATLTGHTFPVYSVAFSPDGHTLASGSYDNKVKLWDAESGKLRISLDGHRNAVYVVTFSFDGRTLASGSYDETIKLWDAASGGLKATLKGHKGLVQSLAFSPSDRTLASGGVEGTLKQWEMVNKQPKATFRSSLGGWSPPVAFTPDVRILASGGGGQVKLWKIFSGELMATLPGHEAGDIYVAFGPDGRTLASWSRDRTIRLWDVASGELKATLTGHKDEILSVIFSPDGHTLASRGDSTIKLWDVASGTLKATHPRLGDWSLSFAPDGQTLAVNKEDDSIKLWDLATGKLKVALTGLGKNVSVLAISPDGRTLASSSMDPTIKLWDTSSGELRATLLGHEAWGISAAFSPDGRTLASGSYDDTIKLWDVASGELKASLPGHDGIVDSLVFASDGYTLASLGGIIRSEAAVGKGATIKLLAAKRSDKDASR